MPLEFNLTNLFLVLPLREVKSPPVKILPSDWSLISVGCELYPVPKFE